MRKQYFRVFIAGTCTCSSVRGRYYVKKNKRFFLKLYLGRLVSIYVIIIRYVTGIESPGCTARFE